MKRLISSIERKSMNVKFAKLDSVIIKDAKGLNIPTTNPNAKMLMGLSSRDKLVVFRFQLGVEVNGQYNPQRVTWIKQTDAGVEEIFCNVLPESEYNFRFSLDSIKEKIETFQVDYVFRVHNAESLDNYEKTFIPRSGFHGRRRAGLRFGDYRGRPAGHRP